MQTKRNKFTTRDMILVSLFAALTAIGAFIKIYNPLMPMVPFTLQFLFCAYAGILLGSRKGFYSQLLYVGIGLLGIPVFTKGGGFGYIFQPTFGYLIGFVIAGFVIGKLNETLMKNDKDINIIKMFISIMVGLIIVYGIGVSYIFMIVKLYKGVGSYTMGAAIATGFTPYIIPDTIMSLLVAISSSKILPILRRAGYTN